MNEFMVYLLKVSVAIALIIVPYMVTLRNDANLVVKRVYLLSGILLSWLFPMLTIQKPAILPVMEPMFFIDPTVAVHNITAETTTSQLSGLTFVSLLGILYFSGILLFILLNGVTLVRNRRSKCDSSAIKNILLTNGNKVFSIYPNIYLPKKYEETSEVQSILIHERAHIRQLHFADLLIAELSLALTWFNPFSWLISRMIKENHEHLADREVLQQGVSPAHYKALLLNHAFGGEVFRLGHQFNHSLTKKRFKMMKKIKAQRRGILKYILFVPTILAFTLLATAAGQKAKIITGNIYLESADTPATGASVIVLGTTVGTVADSKGAFSIEVTGNPELAISFVGYETKKLKANEIQNSSTIMIPSYFEIMPEEYPVKNSADNSISVRMQDDEGKSWTITSEGSLNLKDGKELVYVVDGVVCNSIENIDPESIVSINVIKDADDPMAKKYNAKTGLLIITTKEVSPSVETKKSVNDKKEEEVFYIVEDIPSFPGGKIALGEYIYSNLQYPPEAMAKQLAGKVMVAFTVKGDGSLENIRVIQSTNTIFDDAALQLFASMPAWKPGKQRGKPVKTNVTVPVRFNPEKE